MENHQEENKQTEHDANKDAPQQTHTEHETPNNEPQKDKEPEAEHKEEEEPKPKRSYGSANHAVLCLGARPPRFDKRTLRLANYLGPNLPVPPATKEWSSGITNWGMLGNDQLGDCTIAGVAHLIMAWKAANKCDVTFTDQIAVKYYSAWDGYVPGIPGTDQGGVELDVLAKWRKQGFAGHLIGAFASVNANNQTEVMQAMNLFGGLYSGLALPITAQTQDVWDYDYTESGNPDAAPGSWGGHCTAFIDYDADGVTMITWGQLKKATWRWVREYATELHAIISTDFLNAKDIDPDGVNLSQLNSDLTLVTA